MTKSDAVELQRSLKQDVPEAQVEQVLKLGPRGGHAVVSLLEDALATAPPIVEVAILDVLLNLTHDKAHADALDALRATPAAKGEAGEELRTMIAIALQRYASGIADGLWSEGSVRLEGFAARAGAGRSMAAPPESMTVLVHGTWAADGTWWKPEGAFFRYLRDDVGVADLYDGADRFTWHAPNEDKARKNAAAELARWVADRRPARLTLLGHSHGANVAMMATRHGMRVNRLVLLSPVVRQDYFANWSNVDVSRSVYSSHDPVVAIAKGRKRFPAGPVRQKRLAARGHGASRSPSAWSQERVASFVGLPHE